MVLLPAGRPAVGLFVYFLAIVSTCFISCYRSLFALQPLLLTNVSRFRVVLGAEFSPLYHRQRCRRSVERHRQPRRAAEAAATAAAAAAAAAASAAAAAAVGVYCVSLYR